MKEIKRVYVLVNNKGHIFAGNAILNKDVADRACRNINSVLDENYSVVTLKVI